MALINVPLTGQSLGITKVPINTNFATIDTAFQVDHVDYGTANQGMHAQVTFVNNPGATFAAGNIGLFNQTALPTTIPDIWLARGTAAAYPMTGYASINAGNNGWTYFPSGMLLTWGQATTSGGAVTVTFNNSGSGGIASFPGFATFVANISGIRIDNSGSSTTVLRVKSYTLTTATFGLANGSTDITFFWSALGI